LIILDANILYKGPDTVTTDLLQTIRAAGAEEVGIPSVALEELVAQRVNPYRERYEAASTAWKKIVEDSPGPCRRTSPVKGVLRLRSGRYRSAHDRREDPAGRGRRRGCCEVGDRCRV
jgi:hypothetical protein